jgi:hypothetical protein
MMDRTSLLLASFRRPPEDAHSPTVTAGWEAAGSGNANSPLQGKIAMTRQSASDIVVRAALSQADRHRILALPYPVEYQVFWQLLAGLGMTQECLMDRMGGSP